MPICDFGPTDVLLRTLAVCFAFVACGGDGGESTTEPDPTPQPTVGTLEVTANTTGDTPDSDGYTVSLNGMDGRHLESNGTVTFSQVDTGNHQVGLTGLQINCELEGAHTRTVSVTAGQTAGVAFDVLCPRALLNQIAFRSSRNPAGLYFMETDGSSPTWITAGNDPSISPDGRRVAFASSRDGDTNAQIYVINVDGTGLQRVTEIDNGAMWPAWSPDGSRIAFGGFADGDEEIYTVNPDGTGLKQVTDNAVTDAIPDWSPDGMRIVFQSGSVDPTIFTISPDGTGLEQVIDDGGAAAWSPDGSRIAFSSDRDGNFDLYTVHPDGSGLEQVTNNDADEGFPTWSPDGSRIAFTLRTITPNVEQEIYVINLDHGGLVNLTVNPASDALPDWGPQP